MESKNFVNLNVNPCKACMPLGAATAFKGIENSMMILHGSQGCSTYIRRHMAGHYNEPIDIASSSLNEEGTVYGGESNLMKGLDNVIKLYNPRIIGVATTCLAETIGEDIKRIINKYLEQKPSDLSKNLTIVPVSTAGYAGTQFEGFYSALFSIVQNIVTEKRSGKKINIIAGNINPGDIRNIKSIIEQFTDDYVILPDISDTLDAPYKKEYNKLNKIKDK
jgi:nitrogenase molybdenum-iron protein NifN